MKRFPCERSLGCQARRIDFALTYNLQALSVLNLVWNPVVREQPQRSLKVTRWLKATLAFMLEALHSLYGYGETWYSSCTQVTNLELCLNSGTGVWKTIEKAALFEEDRVLFPALHLPLSAPSPETPLRIPHSFLPTLLQKTSSCRAPNSPFPALRSPVLMVTPRSQIIQGRAKTVGMRMFRDH